MATKIPPKNFDNKLSRRKQDLNQIAKNESDIAALQELPVLPTPGEGDEGKIPKVNAEGGYTLGTNNGLPDVTVDDNGKLVQVVSGSWQMRTMSSLGIVCTDSGGLIGTTYNNGIRVISSASTPSFYMYGSSIGFSSIIARIQNTGMVICIDDNGTLYKGFISKTDASTIYALITSDGITLVEAIITASSITYQRVSNVIHLNVTVTTGLNAISLPDSMTYDDLKALLDVSVVYIVDDDTNDIYSIENYDSSSATFRHIDISTAYVLVDSIEFNNLGGTYSQARVEIHTPNP